MRKRIFGIGLVLFAAATAAAHPPAGYPTARRPLADTIPLINSLTAISLRDTGNKTALLRFTGKAQAMVIVFLSPECPLCQNYSSVLDQLSGQYKGQITFYGIIPGKSYPAATVKKFRDSYHIRFDLLLDPDFQLTRLLKATTTPQVFLISRESKLLYTGLIDNRVVSLRVRRTNVTEYYLASAIGDCLHHVPVNCSSTRPIGCLINDY